MGSRWTLTNLQSWWLHVNIHRQPHQNMSKPEMIWDQQSFISDTFDLLWNHSFFCPEMKHLHRQMKQAQIIDSEKVIGALIISCCWCCWSVYYLFCLQTGCVAGVHLQVFGDQSGGDWVHRCFVSQKHWKGFISVLFKVKHLSEEKIQKNIDNYWNSENRDWWELMSNIKKTYVLWKLKSELRIK